MPGLPPLTPVDRMAAVEEAAAHDFREELTIILNGVDAALRRIELLHPAREYLRDAREAAIRAHWQTQSLLNHARQNGARPSAVTLERITEL